MPWTKDPRHQDAAQLERLAYPPSGGVDKLVFLGIVLPLVIGFFGVRAWVTGEAFWYGSRGSGMTVRGPAAQALAVVYVSAALFCHFRWCWGLTRFYRIYETGTVLSLLGVAGGIFYGIYRLFV